ncbi:DUF1697 domain-containing protein [Terrabacter aerolatus]|uniref:DUF1697 domain-containing protein n=1 Tax=Terrabacter aerolatus TaxID=422442 RepID=A0A512D263_9MICO|nr:DUF1697 domain-containing protein [Terrabacter aerolatus]GEO30533.1 hypothetical protein TAE01_23430 [Terrabacter aerolatus]
MPTYIAFLRAVNVGQRWVKMERLRAHLSDNGFGDVVTHIQSGNVCVTTSLRSVPKVEASLRSLISDEFGFDVPVVVRTPAELRRTAAEADAVDSPLGADARRYVTFTTGGISTEGAQALEAWDVPGERVVVLGDDVLLFLTKPAHQAKLTNARLERLTGATGTARDIKVVRALAEKWGG